LLRDLVKPVFKLMSEVKKYREVLGFTKTLGRFTQHHDDDEG